VTGKAVTLEALRLLARAGDDGAVDESRQARCLGLAPSYLTLIQYETASMRNLPAQDLAVASLDEELKVDDDTAARIMPAGLAMYFALIDGDSACYNHFAKLYYETLLPSLKPDECALGDHYGVLADPTMR
jgi:hypothetical protein